MNVGNVRREEVFQPVTVEVTFDSMEEILSLLAIAQTDSNTIYREYAGVTMVEITASTISNVLCNLQTLAEMADPFGNIA